MLELLRAGRGLESWAPTGEISLSCLDGVNVLTAVEPDPDEVERRRQHGLRALTNRRALQVLLSLPPGVAVPLDLLSAPDQRTVRSLPAGVVDLRYGTVSVEAKPALWLRSVGLVARTWKQGLRRSGPFAPYCARYVVLDAGRTRVDSQVAAIEARFYGVGLAVHEDGALSWLVSPAPFIADRFTAASWLMAERLTNALVDGTR